VLPLRIRATLPALIHRNGLFHRFGLPFSMKARIFISSIILLSGIRFLPEIGPSEESRAPIATAIADEKGFAARIDGHEIGMQAYRDYLFRISGRRPLETLIDRHLIKLEAERLKVSVLETDVEAAQKVKWASYLLRYNGDESRFVKDLETGGFQQADYIQNMRDDARHELLAQAVVRATRTVTEEMLLARFSLNYGERGDLVEVRHIFLSAARMRSDLLAQGIAKEELGPAQLEERCKSRLAEVLERLESGEEFAKLAGLYSHEFAAKGNGGMFANYNYRAYGEDFATAVRKASVGEPFGPVQTEAGFHIIEVTSRTHTEFEDVRTALRTEIEEGVAEMTEIQALIAKLRDGVTVETY
jgi:parvulin-like peptidyl-prolyl isomerase